MPPLKELEYKGEKVTEPSRDEMVVRGPECKRRRRGPEDRRLKGLHKSIPSSISREIRFC